MGDRFGAFDGRFLGITLELDRPAERERLPWLSPAATDSGAAAATVAGVRSEHAFEDLLEATSPTHELRHFHDFMLSPLGAAVVRSRYLATTNAFPLLRWFVWKQGVVPVPLSTWLTMPQASRDAYWQRASRLSAAAGRSLGAPLEVPYAPKIGLNGLDPTAGEEQGDFIVRALGEDAIGDGVLLVASQFARTEYLLGGIVLDDDQWNPAQIFEVSALLVQLRHLALLTSTEVASGVAATMAIGDTPYATVLGRVAKLFGDRIEENAFRVSFPLVSAVATYALLGSCEPESLYGQVMVRFCVIGLHLREHPIEDSESSLFDLFERWDRVLEDRGLLKMPALAGLEASLSGDDVLREVLERELAVPSEEDPTLAAKVSCLEFLKARRKLCERFLADPDSYAPPTRYLEAVGELPRPAVQVTSAPEHSGTAERLLREAGWECLRANESQILAHPAPGFMPGEAGFRLDALVINTDLLMASEMLFADNPAVTEAGTRVLDGILHGRLETLRVSGPKPTPPSSLGEGNARFLTGR